MRLNGAFFSADLFLCNDKTLNFVDFSVNIERFLKLKLIDIFQANFDTLTPYKPTIGCVSCHIENLGFIGFVFF